MEGRMVGYHVGCGGTVEYRTEPTAGFNRCLHCGAGGPLRSIDVVESHTCSCMHSVAQHTRRQDGSFACRSFGCGCSAFEGYGTRK